VQVLKEQPIPRDHTLDNQLLNLLIDLTSKRHIFDVDRACRVAAIIVGLDLVLKDVELVEDVGVRTLDKQDRRETIGLLVKLGEVEDRGLHEAGVED